MPYIYTNPYRSSYLAAVQELEQRQQEMGLLVQRIKYLEETIKSLQPLANEEAPSGVTISQLCMEILKAAGGAAVTVPEVRRRIAVAGITLEYSNPLAVLHTTLDRLSKQPNSRIKIAPAINGQRAFRFVPIAGIDF